MTTSEPENPRPGAEPATEVTPPPVASSSGTPMPPPALAASEPPPLAPEPIAPPSPIEPAVTASGLPNPHGLPEIAVDRPEVALGAAFGGGLVLAMILKRFGR